MPRSLRRALATLAVAVAAAAPAAARELHWRELAVTAQLEADGTMVVSEEHAMVFTGAWNGGERIFDVRPGQRLELDGVWRRDGADGDWRRLERGSLDRVDHWDWSDGSTLRWRSRLPADPDFDSTEIGYRIDYRLSGSLIRDGERYRLDHDFAFPNRVGEIERFRLFFDLDPAWRAEPAMPVQLVAGPLPPGQGYVLGFTLTYVGDGEPTQASVPKLSWPERWSFLALALSGSMLILGWAVRRETAIGRLRPLDPIDQVDRAWIESTILSWAPEEVGAAWDETVGAAEVTAVLARMQRDGQLTSEVETKKFLIFENQVLHLELRVGRDELDPVARKLVDGLFPGGRQRTDSQFLREHYKTSGFDPAKKIRTLVTGRVRAHPGFARTRPRPARWPTAALVMAGAVGLVLSAVARPASAQIVVVSAFFLLPIWLIGYVAAYRLRDRVVGFRGSAVAIAISQALSVALLFGVSFAAGRPLAALVSILLLFWGLTRSVATCLQTRQGGETIARRRELALGRAWMAEELRRPAPRLDDGWLPYLMAFGLAPQMDRWFRAFGGSVAGGAGSSFRGSSLGGSTGSASSWTGGGGAFGGAGATASWAAAATAIGSGVAAASSSSGGGGGGGGGGSSGGGGGGGW